MENNSGYFVENRKKEILVIMNKLNHNGMQVHIQKQVGSSFMTSNIVPHN